MEVGVSFYMRDIAYNRYFDFLHNLRNLHCTIIGLPRTSLLVNMQY